MKGGSIEGRHLRPAELPGLVPNRSLLLPPDIGYIRIGFFTACVKVEEICSA
jgi:hypothetical protein